MKYLAEGFWTTLTLLCSSLVGLVAFGYSLVESTLGSKLIGTSLTGELYAYRLRSWVSLVVAIVCFCVFLFVFGIARFVDVVRAIHEFTHFI